MATLKAKLTRPRWLRWAVGEISKLRTAIKAGSFAAPYKLDSSRVDYAKARALYDNTDDNYKLGAGFAKPVIDTTVGFMGVPQFRSEDDEAQAVLDEFSAANVSRMQQTHQSALREGDCYVWITREEADEGEAALYPEAKTRLVYNFIPPEQVVAVIRDPLTRAVREYVLKSEQTWTDESGNTKRAIVTERISREKRVITVEGDPIPGLAATEEANKWGFIPIVHFKNEGDATSEFGKSELEAIEPFLKAYHDVMLHAMQGSKMHSTPRLKLKLKNMAEFLQNNFGITDPAQFAAQGGTLKLDGHELLIFTDGDDAEFIEVKSATGDSEALLKLLFYCIVDTSETPEFAFGVHTPSSLSSVKEQMPILVRKIARKREQFTESWQRLARIVLAMTAQAENKKFTTYATTLGWDDIDPRDGKDVAAELESIVNALAKALEIGLISQDAAVEFLGRFIDTMNDWISDDPEIPGERERILKTRLRLMRLEDGQLLEAEAKLLQEASQAGGQSPQQGGA